MVIGQMLDWLTFFLVSDQYGVADETNPIVGFVYSLGGGPLVILLFKIIVVLWVLTMANMAILTRNRWMGLTLLAFAAIMGFVGAATNVWSFAILKGG